MEENAFEESEPEKAAKGWLQYTDKSLSRLKNIKKSYYRLGGGPKEREVDCRCNYRSKHSSSFLNMGSDPPQISQESQETASNIEVAVPELVKHQHHDNKPKIKYMHPWQKRRPYSAIVYQAKDIPENPSQHKQHQDKKSHPVNFISIKGQTVSPQARSQSNTSQCTSQQTYKGVCLLHLDPQHTEERQKATLEGLRKYSAYGQDDIDANPVPQPPRGSPVPGSPIDTISHKLEHSIQGTPSDDEFDDDDDELEKMSSCSLTTGSKSLVLQIPTAEIEYGSEDEETSRDTPFISSNDRALSADYVEKSEVFLDELASKQKQENEELSEMFTEMINEKLKVDDVDLRSVLSTPITAQQDTDPIRQGEVSNRRIVNIGGDNTLDDQHLDESVCQMWVEEPYVPRLQGDMIERNVYLGLDRFQIPKRRVQSAKTSRREEPNEFVLKGKTFELLDARDLAVNRRLREQSSFASPGYGNGNIPSCNKTSEVVGKPPRPKSAKKPKVQKRNSSGMLNLKQGTPERKQKIPHPPDPHNPRRSSLKKSLSQGDVRCLSPEVIASVKKTVSFSDEVLDKPTRLLGRIQKPEVPKPDVPKPDVNKAEIPECENPILDVPEAPKPDVINLETPKPVILSREVKNLGVLKQEINSSEVKFTSGEEGLSSGKDEDIKVPNSLGFIIQNGLEIEPVAVIPDSCPKERLTREGDTEEGPIKEPTKKGPTEDGTINESSLNLIAQIKKASRCSCHVERCHCRGLTRPTKAVIFQAKAAKEQNETSTPRGRLLKQRPSRPYSAPIKRDVSRRHQTTPASSQTRITTTEHKQSGFKDSRRVRPVSAHIKRPSAKETRRSYTGVLLQDERMPAQQSDSRLQRKKQKKKNSHEIDDFAFVWGAGDDDVAASEECEEVYAKFKEKGMNISMQTVKRGLMAPARRASENCIASFSTSTSSGLLNRPEKWLPDEYARVKIWDDVLKKGR